MAAGRFDLVDGVPQCGMKRDRQVGRDGPRRRGPDQHRDIDVGERGDERGQGGRARGGDRKLDVDRRRRVRLVLHLGFGKRRPAVDTPVDRLLAAIHPTLFHERPERADDRGLIGEVHGEIRGRPCAEDAKALEVVSHDVDILLGVSTALPAHLGDAHPLLLGPELPIDLELDRQSVAVPSGDVGRVEARHGARPDDEVLENLVEGCSEMHLAVRVRWSVVQDELRRTGARATDPPVEVRLLPACDRLRLGRRQARLHPEAGPREVECLFPVRHGRPTCGGVGRARTRANGHCHQL